MESHHSPQPSSTHFEIVDDVAGSEGWLRVSLLCLIFAMVVYLTLHSAKDKYDDGLFTVNKLFSWEPAYFARFRWITNAQSIMAAADAKVGLTSNSASS